MTPSITYSEYQRRFALAAKKVKKSEDELLGGLPLGNSSMLSEQGIDKAVFTTNDLVPPSIVTHMKEVYECNFGERFPFAPGVNVVCGLPGSGKSALLDAIHYELNLTAPIIVYDDLSGPIESRLVGSYSELFIAIRDSVKKAYLYPETVEPILCDSITSLSNVIPEGEKVGFQERGVSPSFLHALRKWDTMFAARGLVLIMTIGPPSDSDSIINMFTTALSGSVTTVIRVQDLAYDVSSRIQLPNVTYNRKFKPFGAEEVVQKYFKKRAVLDDANFGTQAPYTGSVRPAPTSEKITARLSPTQRISPATVNLLKY